MTRNSVDLVHKSQSSIYLTFTYVGKIVRMIHTLIATLLLGRCRDRFPVVSLDFTVCVWLIYIVSGYFLGCGI